MISNTFSNTFLKTFLNKFSFVQRHMECLKMNVYLLEKRKRHD